MLIMKYSLTVEDTLISLLNGLASPAVAALSYNQESTILGYTGASLLQTIFTWIGYATEISGTV